MNTNTKRIIYADCAAQARPRACALEAARQAMEVYGNPSGVHRQSKAAARLLFDARKKVAAALNAQPSEISFVSSATEGVSTAIFSALEQGRKSGRTRLLVFAGEHHAVLYGAENAARLLGGRVEHIPCLADGQADLDAFEKQLGEDVCLCALMAVNNETGVIQPVERFCALARSRGSLSLVDGSQAVGHIPADVTAMGCDFFALSAHKFGGIAGAGALFCRNGLSLSPLLAGGGQESGRRAGTEAVTAIAAMGAAMEAATAAMDEENRRIKPLRDLLEQRLGAREDVLIVGSEAPRIDSTLCLCLKNTDGEGFALYLDLEGICVSSGAACTTGSDSASHVLQAMGVPVEYIRGSLRFSFDTHTTAEDIEHTARTVAALLDRKAAALR